MLFLNKNNNNENVSQQKMLDLQLQELKSQNDNLKKFYEHSQKEYNKLSKEVMEFCKSILDREYALSQIGDYKNTDILNMSVEELIKFANKNISKQKNENSKLLIKMKDDIDLKEKTIEDLKDQLSQFLIANNFSKEEIKELFTAKKESEKPIQQYSNKSKQDLIEDDVVEPIITPIVNSIKNNAEESNNEAITVIEIDDKDIKDIEEKKLKSETRVIDNNTKEKNQAIAHIIDLTQIIKNMSDVSWYVIEAIGVKGLSEKNDISNYIKAKDTNISDSTIDNVLQELKVSSIIDRERISTGWRSFFVYELTDTGVRVFKESNKFDGDPVLCERRVLIRQHATAKHGYGIKDAATILKDELNFFDLSYDKNKTQVELPNGDIYIPDIVATDPISNEKKYFEYELAHHTQKDFNDKCNKMKMVTNNLYFIVPTTVERRKVQNQINNWLVSKGRNINVSVYITTTRNLKKGKWDSDDDEN